MKHLITLCVVCLAAYFGYKFEPALRQVITGIPYQANRLPANQSDLNIDPTTLRPDQLPKEVSIYVTIPFKDESSGLTANLMAGSKHPLLKVMGSDLQIQVKDTKYKITLPISKTDLLQQLAHMPLKATIDEPAELPPTKTEPEPAPPKPQTETPGPITNTPQPAATSDTPVDALKLMRDSLQNNSIKEFAIDQIVTWSPGGEETFDGETYTTGTVSYESSTILGQKTMQAKALIKNGSIQKWIHAKSGIEIK
jgi:hypothetical protein